MSSPAITEHPRVVVENIGGIDSTTVTLETGVNVLTGKNATNRTSFLRSLMAALGSDKAALKADATSGFVRLQIGDRTYERRFERQNDHVVVSGEPYLDDPTLANLFAFLLESNTARQAVSQQRDLREVIMEPVDVDGIESEIELAKAERRQIDEELDRLETTQSRLPGLEAKKQSLTTDLEEVEATLEERRRELEAVRSQSGGPEDSDLDALLDELQEARGELEETGFQRDTEAQSIETLEAELEELQDEQAKLPSALESNPEAIEAELDELRERVRSIESATTQLQSIIQFNEEMLEGTNPEITAALQEPSSESVTNKLLEDSSTVVCWTCGSEVEQSQIESTVDRLNALRQEKLSERNKLRKDIDDRQATLREADQIERKRRQLVDRIEDTEAELKRRRERLERLDTTESDLEARIEELETQVERAESASEDETLDRQKDVTELEFRRSQIAKQLESVSDEIDDAEAAAGRIEELQEERERVSDRLTDLRTRIERIERESVEAFNEHMASVLDILEYDNLARIWIEQTERTVREGRQHVDQSVFELHIVRQTDDGETYEDTLEHLSESEREVTGLVFALAGYLVHEVYEEVPFMLLDSLEAIDSTRIAALIDYFSTYAETVVTALLPEDAAALDEDYRRITSI